MKKLLLLLIILSKMTALQAQCGAPQSSINLQGNNIRARILNGGDLFTDFSNSQFIPNHDPTSSSNPGTIFTAGLWMGGIDPAGNLKIAAVDYRGTGKTDYSAGPLFETGVTDAFTCANWDRHFRVTGSEISTFLASLPMSQSEAIAQFPSIMGWPGTGNTSFTSIWGFDLPLTFQPLAPFYDADQNGQYNPLLGDYPAVLLRGQQPFVPAEIIWCVFNDQRGGAAHTTSGGAPIRAEVQLTAWAFNCPDEPVLNNTVFTLHKLINRSTEPIDSFFIGLWVDFDLGCFLDDYVGCDISRNTMYAYNQDAIDGNLGSACEGGSDTYGNMPPVQTVTFLPGDQTTANTLDKCLAYGVTGSSASSNPVNPLEFYRNLSGAWRTGAPLTAGGTGLGGSTPVDHIFPNDPADPNGWSMCTSNIPSGDRQVLGTQQAGQLVPGQILEMATAWAVHFNTPPPCNLGNALNEVDIIRAHHANGYTGVCSPVSKAPVVPPDSLDLFPNPTTGEAILRYGAIQVEELRIFDAAGKLIQSVKNLEKRETRLHLGQYPTGMYTLRLFTDQGTVTKKLAVVR